MAAATISQIFRHHNNNNSNDSKSSSSGGGNNNKNISSLVGHEVSRQEIQAAIAKAVELRALHAALVQGNSPAHVRFASSSPVPLPYSASHFSAEDYPVFTPSYEDDPPPGYQQIALKGRTLSETWDEVGLGLGTFNEGVLSDYRKENSSLRKGLHSQSVTSDTHVCPGDDQRSVTGSCANLNIQETSPGADFYKSTRRNSMEDLQSISSCNKCKPAIITSEAENITRTSKNSNLVVPLTNPLSSVQLQTKSRGVFLSRLFPRLKKKHKNESSPNRTESEEVSQIIKDLGIVSVEALKKELIEANEHRDAALSEVSEMKSSLGELRQKLQYLETYCEGLKKALKQATQSKEPHLSEINSGAFPVKGKSINANDENLMPVSEEVMTEGFLQMVSESRLSVKQFSKTLVGQIEETDGTLMENLNSLLRPHKLALNSRYSKVISYHLEAIINQSLYQDFENCVFQKNGSPKILDPHQDRQAQFASFVALRNLSWNEVLRKGTKYYSEEFSKFCDQKMSCIIATLNWTRPWPEQLLQAFFVAAKCVWLLHLLAFSFSPPIGILRVEENRPFDPRYMEDIFADRQRPHGSSRVKIMVMPGFYVHDRVLRSKVLCRYKSAP